MIGSSLLIKNTAVLNVLGLEDYNDLALKSGLSIGTVRRLMGHDRAYSSRYKQVILLHDALHAAFTKRKPSLRRGQLAHVIDWALEWREKILANFSQTGFVRSSTPQSEYERGRKRKKARRLLADSFAALPWEAL